MHSEKSLSFNVTVMSMFSSDRSKNKWFPLETDSILSLIATQFQFFQLK